MVTSPLIVGAMGGSGTRAVSLVLQSAGYWMGGKVNPRTQDSVPFRRFLGSGFNLAIRYPEIGKAGEWLLAAMFGQAVRSHRRGMPRQDMPWGWKNPRNMWVVPYYLSRFPDLKFIHLVRDGRDMSLSGNTYLLKHHGDRLLGRGWESDIEGSQLELWAMGNLRAAAVGGEMSPDRYLLLRYEDLCAEPRDGVRRIFRFLGIPPSDLDALCEAIRPSHGIGRAQDLEAQAPVSPRVQEALSRFGYAA